MLPVDETGLPLAVQAAARLGDLKNFAIVVDLDTGTVWLCRALPASEHGTTDWNAVQKLGDMQKDEHSAKPAYIMPECWDKAATLGITQLIHPNPYFVDYRVFGLPL